MEENQDNSLEDITDVPTQENADAQSDAAVALAEPGEDLDQFSPGTPPEGHRTRVDPADLEQEKKETDVVFKNRKREYETEPDSYSPTGRKKSKIYLQDFDVISIGKKKVQPARIKGVPEASDAIREFMLLRNIKHAAGYRFRAFPIPDTKRDAGEAGYASNHVPDGVKERRANEGG